MDSCNPSSRWAKQSARNSDVKPAVSSNSTNRMQKQPEAAVKIERSALHSLSKATLTFDFLESNSVSHTIFAAIAELVDNAKDAGATACDIELSDYKDDFQTKQKLIIVDNGTGMDTNEVHDVIMFGKSAKTGYGTQIGMYGLGMKAGAMRIAKDMLVLTKRHGHATCLLLSRTFLESYGLQDVHVAVPAFHVNEKMSPYCSGGKSAKLHNTEMEIVLNYSPFRKEEDLLKQFDRIQETGTLIILFNLRRSRTDPSKPEMLCTPDGDVVLADPEGETDNTDRRSLRSYLAVLYSKSNMGVTINRKRVLARRLDLGLFKPHSYTLTMRGFESVAKHEIEQLKKEITKKENLIGDIGNDLERAEVALKTETDLERKRDIKDAKRDAERERDGLRMDIKKHKEKITDLEKQTRLPAELEVIVGLSIQDRSLEGVYMYNNNRLVRFFRHQPRQRQSELYCRGVVATCDVPRNLMRPTQNKQRFHDESEFKKLKDKIMPCIEQYWVDSKLCEKRSSELLEFWAKFGYCESPFADPPSKDIKFVKERNEVAGNFLQCTACARWRKIPSAEFTTEVFKCIAFKSTVYNSCQKSEEEFDIPKGSTPSKRPGVSNAIAHGGWSSNSAASNAPKPDKLAQFRQQCEAEKLLTKPHRHSHNVEIIDPDDGEPISTQEKNYGLRFRALGDTFAEEDEDEDHHSFGKRVIPRSHVAEKEKCDRSYRPGMSTESTKHKSIKRTISDRDVDIEVTDSDSEPDWEANKSRKNKRMRPNDSDKDGHPSNRCALHTAFRNLLSSLAPENFHLKPDEIEEMSDEKIDQFPVSDFIKCIKNNTKTIKRDAEIAVDIHHKEAEAAKRELLQLRRNVAAYLRAAGIPQIKDVREDEVETNSLDIMLEKLCERTRAAKENDGWNSTHGSFSSKPSTSSGNSIRKPKN